MDNRLGELLSFMTGKNNLPALGFSQQPKVEFLHEGDTDEFTRGLPKAHACFNVLKLPVTHKTTKGLLEVLNNVVSTCSDIFTDY